LKVEVLKSKTGSYHVVVQDVIGRTIYEAIEHQSTFKIDLKSLHPGIYFIRVNDSEFKKIIKTKYVQAERPSHKLVQAGRMN
jgi:hypothetical protein